MKQILIGIVLVASWTVFVYVLGNFVGVQKGLKEALKTNPPSYELEMTCAGLWVGEQNKKYWEKENK